MSRKYKIRDQKKLYFVTFTVIDWIDLFIRDEYKNIIIESIKYCQVNKNLEVYGYCIMTSHVHLIIGTCNSNNALEDTMRDMKSYTSRKIREAIENSNVVHPVSGKWSLVDDFTKYPHSSAAFYERDEKSDVELMHYKDLWKD